MTGEGDIPVVCRSTAGWDLDDERVSDPKLVSAALKLGIMKELSS
jgi:hypothetical protein